MSEKGFTDRDVLQANQQLLTAITDGDYETYLDLMSPDLVAIEPESKNLPVHGLGFHKYFFDLYSHPTMAEKSKHVVGNVVSMSSPHVRWLGGGCCSDGCGEGTAAVVSYVRVDQTCAEGSDGPTIRTCTETRVWENRDGKLINVHFHRS